MKQLLSDRRETHTVNYANYYHDATPALNDSVPGHFACVPLSFRDSRVRQFAPAQSYFALARCDGDHVPARDRNAPAHSD